MTVRPRVLAALACAACALPAVALAQARAGDETPSASPLAPFYERFDEALSQGVVGADDAASRWISGRLSSLEPAAQLRDFAAAVAREPREPLYVASLADACMRPYAPVPAECTDRDSVGYWSSRDADNAVPWLLQAERARRRNNVAAMIDNLERAARATRYDDYSGRGGTVIAGKLIPRTGETDRAAAVLYAQQQGTTPLGAPLSALEAVCAAPTRALDERIPRHCIRLGALMTERATSFVNRRAGAQVALASAPTDSARGATTEAARIAVLQQDRCREAFDTLGRFAAGSSAQRASAASAGQRYLDERAKSGEPAACDALVKSLAAGR
jgi:hypothetical protein